MLNAPSDRFDLKKILQDNGFSSALIEQAERINISEEAWQELIVKLTHKRLLISGELKADITAAWQIYALAGDVAQAMDHLDGNVTSNLGLNVAHYVALSGSVECLPVIQAKDPNIFQQQDKKSRTVAYYAIYSGNPKMLENVLNYDPNQLFILDNDNRNLAHITALYGNLAMLKHVWSRYFSFPPPLGFDLLQFFRILHFLLEKDKYGVSIRHFSVWSGNVDVQQEVFDRVGYLNEVDSKSCSLAHYAIFSDNPAMLKKLLSLDFNLMIKADVFDRNIAHLAALLGNLAMLKEVMLCAKELSTEDKLGAKSFRLFQKPTLLGYNLAHFAALSGNSAVLGWVQYHFPDLLAIKNALQKECDHFSELSGNKELAATLQSWLKGDSRYLVLDDIGRIAAALMTAIDNNSPSQLQRAYAEFSLLDKESQIKVLDLSLTLEGECLSQRLASKLPWVIITLMDNQYVGDNYECLLSNFQRGTSFEHHIQLLQQTMKYATPKDLGQMLKHYSLEWIFQHVADKEGMPDVTHAPKTKREAFTRVILQEAGLIFAFKGQIETYFNPKSSADVARLSGFFELIDRLANNESEKMLTGYSKQQQFGKGFRSVDRFFHRFETCVTCLFGSDSKVERAKEFSSYKPFIEFKQTYLPFMKSQKPLVDITNSLGRENAVFDSKFYSL